MRTRIQKWGNSLAVRIPKSFATEIKVKQGSEAEVLLEKGKLVVSPVVEDEFTLEYLLSGITEKNRHQEIDTGQSTGNEVW